MDAHHPFLPPKQFTNISIKNLFRVEEIIKENPSNVSQRDYNIIKKLYQETILYIDSELGRFFQKLKELNLFEESLFLITADHGEEFKEHGAFSHVSPLYEELIHVPLIIKGPEIKKDKMINRLVSLIDLPPTILAYLGLENCVSFKGHNLLPLLTGNDSLYIREGVLSETLLKEGKGARSFNEGYRVNSYRTEDWKLIINEEIKSKEFYSLINDPMEEINVYNTHKKIVHVFEQKIQEHVNMELLNIRKFNEMININKSLNNIQFDPTKI